MRIASAASTATQQTVPAQDAPASPSLAMSEMAGQIIEALGGAGNIRELTHCATRLHVTLADESKADLARIEAVRGVLGAFPRAGGRYQVIIGGAVGSVYERMMSLIAAAAASPSVRTIPQASIADRTVNQHTPQTVRSWANAVLDYVSDAFRPLLGVLLGASMVIALANVIVSLGFSPDGNVADGWRVLEAIWEGMFVMLPIMIAVNASHKLNVDPWLGGAIMAALLAPRLGGLGASVSVFGMSMPVYDYGGNVFVPLLMVAVLAAVYHRLKQVIPGSVQLVFVPFFSLVVVYVLSVLCIGPMGVWIGDGLGEITSWMSTRVPFLFALCIPLLYPFLVPLGLHWPLNALMLMNIETLGYDFVQGPMGVWNFACFGATAGVLVLAVRDKDSAMRQMSLSALLAGLLGGISELSLYGIHLQHRRIYRWLLSGCAAGGLTSAVLSWLFPSVLASGQVIRGVTTTAFAFSSLLTIPVFDRAWVYAISIAVAFAVAMTLTVAFDYRLPQTGAGRTVRPERSEQRDQREQSGVEPERDSARADRADQAGHMSQTRQSDCPDRLWNSDAPHAVFAPVSGELVDLAAIDDPVFASKALGEGVGLMPEPQESMAVCAPVSGTLKTVAKTGHAFGVKTDDGVEVLVHIGLDTADMGGEGFALHKRKGDVVSAGDVILHADCAAIQHAGHSAVVVVTVVNTAAMASVTPLPAGIADRPDGAERRISRTVTAGTPIIDVER
ncbi:glucose PTS transporter subunit IIA [Bifidobacterium olomucense]|uniref:PTS sugar transporter subunit IIC n=1 Tax=Bifidobacterium olomucense TaxID=2675324 RepID=A0A7Y0EVM5_9BIFI|nr:glucose PTS transporter subunit IIA [Bifidobacterium sp. DSM 109959]NMM97242.1 PTS sugar transporter subunit IIC [Bifidobacterium sp. DSM 109959]